MQIKEVLKTAYNVINLVYPVQDRLDFYRESMKVKVDELRLLRSQYSVMSQMMHTEEGAKQARDYDVEAGYELLGGAASSKEIYASNRQAEVKNARRMYDYHANIGGPLDVMKNYISGCSIVPTDDSDEVYDYWEEYNERDSFDDKQEEIVIRVLRDGEGFIRKFISDGSDGLDAGRCSIRFIDPERIPEEVVDNNGIVHKGIETDTNDVTKAIAYYTTKEDGSFDERIPADQIIHVKIGVDSNVKRGRTVLRRGLKKGERYSKWDDYRLLLSFVRNAIAIVRSSIEGTTPGRIGAVREEHQSTKWSDVDNKVKMFKPGSVITANGFDYKMLSPNLDAKDSAEDGRRLKLDIAAGLGLSELHVSADASNGNYASLSVAETPAIMTIKSWQRFFMRVYAKIFKFVIETGVQYKLIPPETKRLKRIRKEDGGFEVKLDKFPTSTKANIIPQSVVPRKLKAEVEAYQIMKLNGWLADESAMGLLGIQADKEREIMDYEASLKKDDPEQNDPDDPNGPKGKNNPAYKQKNPPKDKEWDNIEKLREELEEIKDALRQLLGR